MFDPTDLAPLKPVLTALALPPVPLLVVVLIGTRLMAARRKTGVALIVLGLALMWLSACQAVGRGLQDALLRTMPPLSAAEIAGLKPSRLPSTAPPTAIVMLGSGLILRAPETGMSDLTDASAARLRYGINLSRQTGLPMAYSGGVGWAQQQGSGLSEAEAAQHIAERDFLRPIRWAETGSRDTRENATRTVSMLKDAGVRRVVLVTHAWHMPRALRAFRTAAGDGLQIIPAPMGYFPPADRGVLDWMPSSEGFMETRLVLREALGLALGF